jgi:hypothetical protein
LATDCRSERCRVQRYVGASQRTLHARSRDCSPVPRYLPRWRGKAAAGLRQAAMSPLARCADLGPHPLRLHVAPRRVPQLHFLRICDLIGLCPLLPSCRSSCSSEAIMAGAMHTMRRPSGASKSAADEFSEEPAARRLSVALGALAPLCQLPAARSTFEAAPAAERTPWQRATGFPAAP